MCIYIYIYMYAYIYIYIYIYICIHTWCGGPELSIYLSIYLSLSGDFSPNVNIYIYIYIGSAWTSKIHAGNLRKVKEHQPY